MGRYYKIVVSDQGSGSVIRQWSSQNTDGSDDPNALNVEFDLVVAPFATPVGSSFVRVWGIPLTDIAQATQLTYRDVKVYGGMSKGLPLANPSQQGLLAFGSAFPAFGNWRDEDQTIDMNLVAANTPQNAQAINLAGTWKAGTPLAQMIQSTLTQGFPGTTADVSGISSSLVLAHDEPFFYGSLEAFANYVKGVSLNTLNPSGSGAYRGVDITLLDKKFIAYDGTTQKAPRQIAFQDMVGQVTWSAANIINFNTVMRGDINIGDYVKLPPGQVATTAQSYPQYRQGAPWAGVFQIFGIRHVGNFRSEDGNYWVSNFFAYDTQPANVPANG